MLSFSFPFLFKRCFFNVDLVLLRSLCLLLWAHLLLRSYRLSLCPLFSWWSLRQQKSVSRNFTAVLVHFQQLSTEGIYLTCWFCPPWLGSTHLGDPRATSNPGSPSSSPHTPSALGSGVSDPVLNGGLCSAAYCSSAGGRSTPTGN